MATPTGGFTSITGESLLVTPGGTAVGSAARPSGSGVTSARQTRMIREAEERRRAAETRRIRFAREAAQKSKALAIKEKALKSAAERQSKESSRRELLKRSQVIRQRRGVQAPQIIQSRQPTIKQPEKQQFILERPVKVNRGVRNVFGLGETIQKQSLKLSTKQARGGTLKTGVAISGLAIASVGVGTVRTVLNPVQSVKNLFSSAKTFAKNPIGLTKSGGKAVGIQLRTNPSKVIGTAAGIFLTQKAFTAAPKGVLKGTDRIRTIGLKEFPSVKIIAPEIAKGQTFPAIKKGQTAGQLLKEFQPLLPGETKAAGFTATPKPFKSSTVAGAGTSEIPGVFQAPKLSSRFLRISGEGDKKLFSFKIFDTFRPTAVRITPTKFELLPGVKPSRKNLVPQAQAQKFFGVKTELIKGESFRVTGKLSSKATKGKSFVTFIKTEKESIIPFDTPLTKTGQRFFFKTEGRRIPIAEFEAQGLTKAVKLPKPPKITTARSAASSSRALKSSSAVFSPTSFVPLISSTTRGSSLRRGSAPSGRRNIPSSISRTPTSSNIFAPSSSRGGGTPSRIITPAISRSLIPPSSRRTPPKTTRQFIPTTRIPTPRFKFTQPKTQTKQTGRFPVFLRRFGTFRQVGIGRTRQQAFNIGTRKARTTLGATFKVGGLGKTPLKIPGFKTKKTKKGTLFIEQSKFRLSTGSELKEIQGFKQLKGGIFK